MTSEELAEQRDADPREQPLSLGEALPLEMARVRDKIMPQYIAIGPAGAFALAVMRVELNAAANAMIEGDVVAMMRAYQSLKDFEA